MKLLKYTGAKPIQLITPIAKVLHKGDTIKMKNADADQLLIRDDFEVVEQDQPKEKKKEGDE